MVRHGLRPRSGDRHHETDATRRAGLRGLRAGRWSAACGATPDSTSFSCAAMISPLLRRPPGRVPGAESGQECDDRKRRHLDIDDSKAPSETPSVRIPASRAS